MRGRRATPVIREIMDGPASPQPNVRPRRSSVAAGIPRGRTGADTGDGYHYHVAARPCRVQRTAAHPAWYLPRQSISEELRAAVRSKVDDVRARVVTESDSVLGRQRCFATCRLRSRYSARRGVDAALGRAPNAIMPGRHGNVAAPRSPVTPSSSRRRAAGGRFATRTTSWCALLLL